MRYRITHRTRYAYAEPVVAAYGEHHLLPRTTPTQHVLEATVAIDPAPGDRHERTDVWGNRVEHYTVHTEHDELVVHASSLLDVRVPPPVVVELTSAEAREELRTSDATAAIEARAFLLDSPQVAGSAELRTLAERCFTPDTPVMAGYRSLLTLINTEFEFDATATTVTTPVEEVLRTRAGVCQDFAHLLVGCLRSVGLAARYVSGYLETLPPPGQPRLQGADASHAWVSLFVPGHGWVDGDPTNDCLVGEQHLTVGWGRDYGDVAPLKGVIYTDGATEALDVAVDVVRVEDDDAPGAPTTDGAVPPAGVPGAGRAGAGQTQTQGAGAGGAGTQSQSSAGPAADAPADRAP